MPILDLGQVAPGIDETPTKDSKNTVSSGGVYDALQQKSNPNRLKNRYFVDPINQQGVSGVISTRGYFIDCWILVSGKVELTPSGLVLNGEIQQKLEDSVGADTTATALSATGLIEAEYDDELKTFSISANGETLIAAKLELGDQQTLAHQDKDGNWVLNDTPPDKALELAKCQRYFLILGGRVVGHADWFFIPTPVSMRANPALSLIKPGTITYGNGKTASNIKDIQFYALTSNGISLQVIGDGVSQFQPVSGEWSDFEILADSEL